jgi:hypothetical protein
VCDVWVLCFVGATRCDVPPLHVSVTWVAVAVVADRIHWTVASRCHVAAYAMRLLCYAGPPRCCVEHPCYCVDSVQCSCWAAGLGCCPLGSCQLGVPLAVSVIGCWWQPAMPMAAARGYCHAKHGQA